MEILGNGIEYILTKKEMKALMFLIGKTSDDEREVGFNMSRKKSKLVSQIFSDWWDFKHKDDFVD
jgi:hypothetical protein